MVKCLHRLRNAVPAADMVAVLHLPHLSPIQFDSIQFDSDLLIPWYSLCDPVKLHSALSVSVHHHTETCCCN